MRFLVKTSTFTLHGFNFFAASSAFDIFGLINVGFRDVGFRDIGFRGTGVRGTGVRGVSLRFGVVGFVTGSYFVMFPSESAIKTDLLVCMTIFDRMLF